MVIGQVLTCEKHPNADWIAEGFAEFSKLRPVFHQAARPLGAAFLYPPYGRLFDAVYNLLIKVGWR